MGCYFAAIIAVAVLRAQIRSEVSPELVWRVSAVVSVVCILLTAKLTRLNTLSAPIALMWIVWVFHFGLVTVAAINVETLDRMPAWATAWLSENDAIEAICAALAFILSFGAVTYVWSTTYRESPPPVAPARRCSQSLKRLAFVASCIGVATFGLGVLHQGSHVFGESYEEFFDVHNVFSWGVLLIGYSGVMLIASGVHGATLRAWLGLFYAPIAIILFTSGARSAPVATTVAMLIVANRVGIRITRVFVLVSVLVLLIAISVVRELRAVGVGGLIRGESIVATYSPVDGLAELGGSLRPVAATIDYVERHGLYYGATYLYPIVRQLQRLVGVGRVSEFEDTRFVASTINQEYGSIGYSSVAEAYANGGIVGVVLAGAVLGLVLTWLDGRCRTSLDVGMLGAVAIPLLMMVRNSFIFVPAWLAIGVVPVAALRRSALPRRPRRRTEDLRECVLGKRMFL